MNQQQQYDARVFLISYADAISCLQQSAKIANQKKIWQKFCKNIIYLQNRDMISIDSKGRISCENKKMLQKVNAFRCSWIIMNKFMGSFLQQKGEFQDLKQRLKEGLTRMQMNLK